MTVDEIVLVSAAGEELEVPPLGVVKAVGFESMRDKGLEASFLRLEWQPLEWPEFSRWLRLVDHDPDEQILQSEV